LSSTPKFEANAEVVGSTLLITAIAATTVTIALILRPSRIPTDTPRVAY
jgi:hypothetical protein